MKDLEELKNQINILEYAERYVEAYNEKHPEKEEKMEIQRVNDSTYRINPCPICGHKDHFTIYPDTNSYSSFNKDCCKGGSIIDFMQEIEDLEFNKAVRRLYEMTGNTNYDEKVNIEIEDNNTNQMKPKEEFLEEQKKNFILDGIKNQTPEQKEEMYKYVESRGISRKTADRFNLFLSSSVYEDKSLGQEGQIRVVIPVINRDLYNDHYSYVARAISEVEPKVKTLNNAGKQEPLNLDYIKRHADRNKLIYICEGWADTLSIEDVGQKSIAIHSSANGKKFLEELEKNIETAREYSYILCFDNDKAGREATKTVKDGLDQLKLKHLELSIPSQFNDINEWYKNSPESFKTGIDPFFKDNMANYMETKFIQDILDYGSMWSIKTGFKELDEKIGGLAGVTVIGGGSSIGKTTLTHQICDNLAQKGQKIIYFSLEQGRLELSAKSISRQETINENSILTAESAAEIMQNPEPISTKKSVRDNAIDNYKKYANNILIVEGNSSTNIDTIKNYVGNYISITGERPLIVIYYLQMLSSSNPNDSDKKQIDTVMSTLRQMSRDYKVVIIAISSFNRENYTNFVDFKSFKESGSIEYSADIVLGLQLNVVNQLEGNENDKRKAINTAKSGDVREVELVCLKNRNGISNFSCLFNYYPKVNHFVEQKPKEDKF